MAEVSLPIKIAFVLLGLGFLFHIIGFAAPYWHVREGVESRAPFRYIKVNYGLWRVCQMYRHTARNRAFATEYDQCLSILDSFYALDHVRATQFFETVGFLGGIAAIILLILAVCITSCRDRRILPILSAVAAVAAAGCIILGCIIFGAKDGERPFLAWAFALAIVGGIFYGLAGVLVFVATFFIKR